MECLLAFPFFEHFEIVAKVGKCCDCLHCPVANWRRCVLRTHGYGKCGDKFLSIVNFKNLLFGADTE